MMSINQAKPGNLGPRLREVHGEHPSSGAFRSRRHHQPHRLSAVGQGETRGGEPPDHLGALDTHARGGWIPDPLGAHEGERGRCGRRLAAAANDAAGRGGGGRQDCRKAASGVAARRACELAVRRAAAGGTCAACRPCRAIVSLSSRLRTARGREEASALVWPISFAVVLYAGISRNAAISRSKARGLQVNLVVVEIDPTEPPGILPGGPFASIRTAQCDPAGAYAARSPLPAGRSRGTLRYTQRSIPTVRS